MWNVIVSLCILFVGRDIKMIYIHPSVARGFVRHLPTAGQLVNGLRAAWAIIHGATCPITTSTKITLIDTAFGLVLSVLPPGQVETEQQPPSRLHSP